ncbi:MAG: LL-diaminopimelate aminotransferase [Lachnospiraceae bacterium]|nr:LL-diaminopimelate aminotransferase [Lachnospiraceae bacterium]
MTGARINADYKKLQGSYLFTNIANKVREYEAKHPGERVLRLGIGDVTQPIAPTIIRALHDAVEEMGNADSFHGYAPDLGYAFLRETIAKKDYRERGCSISPDEIFVSDGAKCDCGNIQEIFSRDTRIAVCDPVYPVYVDRNVMAGRTCDFDTERGRYREVVYMPCTQETGFVPALPETPVGLIYLGFPNHPTGAVMKKEQLQQWVDYAIDHHAVIIYDAAYEAYIAEEGVPHSIDDCEGAERCAIESRSVSKTAGFTGMRLGFTVIPKALVVEGEALHALWARRHGTKYNGAPYIIQRAGEAVYSPEGRKEVREQVAYYMENASLIFRGLRDVGYEVSGGVNAPYIWLRTPRDMTSWEFFDLLLNEAKVVGTPGVGFGACGEHYFRLTAFGRREDAREAIERIRSM